MRLAGILAASLAMGLIAAPAHACMVSISPEQRIAQGYSQGYFTGVALVRIQSARYVQAPHGDSHIWRASATVRRALRGKYPSRNVTIDGGRGSAACEVNYALPKAGDLWIVYYWTERDGTQAVHQAYPLRLASAADPRVAARIR